MCGIYILCILIIAGCSQYNALVGFPRDFYSLLHSWGDF